MSVTFKFPIRHIDEGMNRQKAPSLLTQRKASKSVGLTRTIWSRMYIQIVQIDAWHANRPLAHKRVACNLVDKWYRFEDRSRAIGQSTAINIEIIERSQLTWVVGGLRSLSLATSQRLLTIFHFLNLKSLTPRDCMIWVESTVHSNLLARNPRGSFWEGMYAPLSSPLIQ